MSLKFCNYCNRPIPDNPRWHRRTPLKPPPASDSPSDTSNPSTSAKKAAVDKASFYGNKMKEQSQLYDNLREEPSQLKRKVVKRSTRGRKIQPKRPYTGKLSRSTNLSSYYNVRHHLGWPNHMLLSFSKPGATHVPHLAWVFNLSLHNTKDMRNHSWLSHQQS